MDRGAADRHSDDELASVLEEEVARITSAIPIILPEALRGGAGEAPEVGVPGETGPDVVAPDEVDADEADADAAEDDEGE